MLLQIKHKTGICVWLLLIFCSSFTGNGPQQDEFRIQPVDIEQDSAQKTIQQFRQTGVASYYGNKFHGRRTASGERYSKNKLTAAHLTLPFGTMVKVTDAKTGRWLVVRINDRGPHNRKRIIDLSYEAARQLGMTRGKGLLKVRIRVVEWPKEN